MLEILNLKEIRQFIELVFISEVLPLQKSDRVTGLRFMRKKKVLFFIFNSILNRITLTLFSIPFYLAWFHISPLNYRTASQFATFTYDNKYGILALQWFATVLSLLPPGLRLRVFWCTSCLIAFRVMGLYYFLLVLSSSFFLPFTFNLCEWEKMYDEMYVSANATHGWFLRFFTFLFSFTSDLPKINPQYHWIRSWVDPFCDVDERKVDLRNCVQCSWAFSSMKKLFFFLVLTELSLKI